MVTVYVAICESLPIRVYPHENPHDFPTVRLLRPIKIIKWLLNLRLPASPQVTIKSPFSEQITIALRKLTIIPPL
jgi:hypothetical protein